MAGWVFFSIPGFQCARNLEEWFLWLQERRTTYTTFVSEDLTIVMLDLLDACRDHEPWHPAIGWTMCSPNGTHFYCINYMK